MATKVMKQEGAKKEISFIISMFPTETKLFQIWNIWRAHIWWSLTVAERNYKVLELLVYISFIGLCFQMKQNRVRQIF